jgi:caa(3)-type oxidase subunit IV
MQEEHAGPSYLAIWAWLVVLLAAGLGVIYLPFLVTQTVIVIIFGIAITKAVLVARYYMHLRGEHVLILAIAGIPVLLAIGFILTLIPDMILNR